LRIALFAPFALRPKGTTVARVLPMARALALAGHECLVLVPPYDNPEEARAPRVEDGLTVEWLPVGRWGAGIGPAPLAVRGYRRIQEIAPDVVHVFKPKAVSGLVQQLVWSRSAAALVLDCDDWEGRAGWSRLESYPWALKTAFDLQERWLLGRNDAATSASRELEERLRRVAPQRPVARVANFHDPARHAGWGEKTRRAEGRALMGLDEAVPVGLVYSRFFDIPVEGYARLVGGFLERAPRAQVVIGGSGKYGQQDRLRSLLARAGVDDRVTWLGWLQPEEIGSTLAAADVALMPALDTVAARSKCPARRVDLLVAGTPVAAHDVGEARTYVEDGRNGRLVAPGDIDALAAAGVELLGPPFGDQARRFRAERLAGDLSPGAAAERLTEIYERARERRGRRRGRGG
jgi:glycosyltransferase involved in cell wall biosynthesis